MTIESSAFRRDLLAELCAFTSAQALRRAPAPTPLMTSDIAWQLPGSDPKANVRLWHDAKELVGYGWFQPPVSLHFDVRPDLEEALLPAILEWAMARRLEFPEGTLPYLYVEDMSEWAEVPNDPDKYTRDEGRVLVAQAFDHDEGQRRCLDRLGFERTNHAGPFLLHRLDLPPLSKSPTVVRAILGDERARYCEAHRDAWGAGSSFDVDRLSAVAAVSGIFDERLCLIAECDGEIAGTCIFWVDPASRIGNIEPFGVRPKFRGRGIGQRLIEGGLHAVRARGMRYCRVSTAGFNHPAQRLYRACGFEDVGVHRSYKRVCT